MYDVDELLSIWEQRREDGKEVSAEELCRKCPDLLPEVRKQIQALRAVESNFGWTHNNANQGTQPTAERLRKRIDLPLDVTSRFRIERHHASGGLGDVFVAVDPVLNRRVAVKFPRAERMSAEQRARFEREARITGRLDHPGIVAVHALKQDDSNQSCYVMRFVDGPTLNDRCRELHSLWQEQRLAEKFTTMDFRRLLEQWVALCDIVAYAHTQGVIHRDIKPANVILGPFGEVLLMDWGLAKVAGEPDVVETNSAPANPPNERVDRGAEVDLTRSGQVMGTPAYAAPEQLLGEVERIDQRSDVFSLGATLRFLLNGNNPLEKSALPQHLVQIAKTKDSPFAVLAEVPRGLNAICRAATAVDPQRRYQSVAAMADDLRRYLANEPVSVLPDSRATKVSRWLRKHPTLVIAGSISALLLMLFSLIGMLVTGSFNRTLEANNKSLSLANASEKEARKSAEDHAVAARETVEKYLVHVTEDDQLKSSDFTELRKELLESARPFFEKLSKVEGTGEAVDRSRAEALFRLADIQQQTGQFQLARANYGECSAIYDRLAQQVPEDRQYKNGQAMCAHNLALLVMELGETVAAKGYLEVAVKLWGELASKYPEYAKFRASLASGYGTLGTLERISGNVSAAHLNFEKVLDYNKQLVRDFPEDPEHLSSLARSHLQLGTQKQLQHELDAAEEHYGQVVSITTDLLQRYPNSEEYRTTHGTGHTNMASLMTYCGKHEKARSHYDLAIETLTNLSHDFPSVPAYREYLVSAHYGYANLLKQLGEFSNAREHLAHAITANELLVKRFPDVPDYRSRLATVHSQFGQLEASLAEGEEALLHHGRAAELLLELSEKFPAIPIYRRNLASEYLWQGNVSRDLGNFSESRKFHERALASMQGLVAELPDDAPCQTLLAAAHHNLAQALADDDALDLARSNYKNAIEIWESLTTRFPNDNDSRSKLASGLENLGSLLDRMGDFEPALEMHLKSLEIRRGLLDAFSEMPAYRAELAGCYDRLGQHFANRHRVADALDWFSKAIAECEILVAEHPDAPRFALELAGKYRNFGNQVLVEDPAGSLQWFEKSESILRDFLTEQPNENLALRVMLLTQIDHANGLDHLGRYEEAAKFWGMAADLAVGDELQELQANRERSLARMQTAIDMDKLLEAGTEPQSPEQRADLAGHCYDRKRYLRSAQEYQKTMSEAPESIAALRFSAASAAVLAACGQGLDAADIGSEQSTVWRKQALEWMAADLAERSENLEENRDSIRGWLFDRDFVSVRDAEAMAHLPEDERRAWQEFWGKVREVVD